MRCPVLATLLFAPAIAAADDDKAPAPAAPAPVVIDDCARARKLGKICVISFLDDDIAIPPPPPPPDTSFSVRPWAYVHSLIRIRRDFTAEMLQSAEGL